MAIGKKRAGRLLDGQLLDAMPVVGCNTDQLPAATPGEDCLVAHGGERP